MPAYTDVIISNMALSHIGDKAITSLGDGSSEADECSLWYEFARAEVLEHHDWAFARKRAALVAHADAADGIDWAYRYTYPSDCLAFRRLVNPYGYTGDAIPFEIEMSDDDSEKTILCNLSTANGVYTFDNGTESMFSPAFVNAFSLKLAEKIAFALTGDRDAEVLMAQRYLAALPVATSTNAREGRAQGPREAESIRARA